MILFQKDVPNKLIPKLRSLGDAVEYFSIPNPDPIELGNPAEELFKGQELPKNVLVLPFIKKKLRNQLLVQKYVEDWKNRVRHSETFAAAKKDSV